jgi:membrane associated rhomboid family serine protease
MFVFLGFFFTTVAVPAYFMLGYWFILQVISALPAVGQMTGGVAFWAHVGGFLAGVGLVYVFRNRRLVEAHAEATGIEPAPAPQSSRRT